MLLDANVPILGAKEYTPSELFIAGSCPNCGGAIFGHTKTTTKGPAIYPTCNCDLTGVPFAIPNEYDGGRERRVVHLLMDYLGTILTDLNSYYELYGPLPTYVQAEEVVDAAGVVLDD